MAGGSERTIHAGVSDVIARCLGVRAEPSPDDLDRQAAVLLQAAERLVLQATVLRARNNALAKVASAEAAVAQARIARDAAVGTLQATAGYAGRAHALLARVLPQGEAAADVALLIRAINAAMRWNTRAVAAKEQVASTDRLFGEALGWRAEARERLAAAEATLALLPATGVSVE